MAQHRLSTRGGCDARRARLAMTMALTCVSGVLWLPCTGAAASRTQLSEGVPRGQLLAGSVTRSNPRAACLFPPAAAPCLERMKGRPKKSPREKDLTSRFLSGGMEDEDRIEQSEQFKPRNKTLQQDKILRTALLRAEEESGVDLEALPIGEVIQVNSQLIQGGHQEVINLSVIPKTQRKRANTPG